MDGAQESLKPPRYVTQHNCIVSVIKLHEQAGVEAPHFASLTPRDVLCRRLTHWRESLWKFRHMLEMER
jgi:hypothetical protein